MSSADAHDGLAVVRSDLRYLMLAQYAYFEKHHTYAPTLDALLAASEFRLSPGNEAELTGDDEGFTAMIRWTKATGTPDRGTVWIGSHAERASRAPAVIYCE